MTPKEAIEKLKHYWVNSGGDDYLTKLVELRGEIPLTHKSSKALDDEISLIVSVHSKFKAWTYSSTAKSKLNKSKSNA